MIYLLFAFLALLSSVGNVIFNRISSHKIGSILSATIKSLMITFACFIICACFGHVGVLYSLTNKEWMWVGILGLVTVVDWLFYFLALKRSHLEAFAPFESSAILFISNLLFSFFTFSAVTNGGSTTNIILFYTGLAFLLASMMYAIFNKKINAVAKWTWVIYSLVSATALAFTLVIVKLRLSSVPSDVVAFHQMSIVFVVSGIMLCFSQDKREITKTSGKTYLNFFISAIFNALMMVFRYLAIGKGNPAIVNIIVGLDFVLVSVATVLFFKANNKKQLVVLILLIVTGMILNALPALI